MSDKGGKIISAPMVEPSIAAMWAAYRENVLEPSGIRGIQLMETRRTFYTAAYAMLNLCGQILQVIESEEEACRVLDGMEREWRDFAGKLQRGEEGY